MRRCPRTTTAFRRRNRPRRERRPEAPPGRRRISPRPRSYAANRRSDLQDERALGTLFLFLRRLVLGEAPLHNRAREHSDEPSVLLDDRYALEIPLLEEVERVVEAEARGEREVRRLGDLADSHGARIEPRGDDCTPERLPRHTPEQLPAVVGDEDRTNVGAVGERAAGVLRARAGGERRR